MKYQIFKIVDEDTIPSKCKISSIFNDDSYSFKDVHDSFEEAKNEILKYKKDFACTNLTILPIICFDWDGENKDYQRV